MDKQLWSKGLRVAIALGIGLMVGGGESAIAPQMAIGLLGHDFFGNYDVQIKENVVEFRPR